MARSCEGVYWNPPMTPRPPALETAAARAPPETRAMPARMMGCWIPRRVVRGVVMGPWGCGAIVMVGFVNLRLYLLVLGLQLRVGTVPL